MTGRCFYKKKAAKRSRSKSDDRKFSDDTTWKIKSGLQSRADKVISGEGNSAISAN